MSDIETTASALKDTLLYNLTATDFTSKLNETAAERITKLRTKTADLQSILDQNTLTKLKNGEYEISLREYTKLNTYNTTMSALYGNNSANPFKNTLNNILGLEDDNLANAKAFIDKMRENGLSNSASIKLYSAIKSYSVLSSFNNYSFVKATV